MEVKIRVGAAVDASMRYAFRPLVQSAIEARRLIMKELGQVPKDVAGLFAAGGRGQSQVFRGVVSEARAAAREQQSLAKQTASEEVKQAKLAAREQTQESRKALADMRRDHAAYEREQRASGRRMAQDAAKSARELDRFATRTSHRFTRFVAPTLPLMSFAHRAAAGVMQGLGVDASLSGSVQRGVAIQSAALQLSNRGHIEGAAGANGQVVDPKLLEKEARGIAGAQAVDADEILKAQTGFVGLTGDLDLARKLMPGIVAQTAAIGGNQEEAAKAAGEFAAHLGDVPDKAEKVMRLMRVAAGQGKIGGVDFSDFAKYAANAASAAPLYSGDAADNTAKLTALAEIAKMHGGARNPAMAFQSIASLTNTLGKGARTKAITALIGGDAQFSDSSHRQFKDPFELAKSIIVAAKGSTDKIQKALGDARAMTAVRGLAVTYNQAGGGASGLQAMDEELKKFKGAIMSEAEIARANKARMEQTEAKAKLFQQQLDQIVQTSATKLIPALEKLAPQALAVADAMGKLITWAAENPWKAVEAALVASFARAGIESAVRGAIEAAIKRGAEGMAVPGGAGGTPGKIGGTLGLAQKGLQIVVAEEAARAAVNLAADQANDLQKVTHSKSTVADLIPGYRGGKFQGGDALIKDMLDVSILAPLMLFNKDSRQNWKRKFGVVGEQSDAVFNMDDRMNADARARYAAERSAAKTAGAQAPSERSRVIGQSGESLDHLRARILAVNEEKQASFRQQQLQEKMATEIASLKTTTLKVEVTNLPGAKTDHPKAPPPAG